MLIDWLLDLINYFYKNQITRLIMRIFYFPLSFAILEKKIWQIIDKKEDKEKIMVNIGGGHFFKRHWKVLDFSSSHYSWLPGTIDFNFNLSLSKQLPFKNEEISFLYSSHTIEHIPQEHVKFLFAEFYRSLKKGGVIRITLPDYDLGAEAYLKNDEDFFEEYKEEETIEAKFLRFFASDLKNKISSEEISKNFKKMEKKEFADFYMDQISRESQILAPGNHINWWNYDKLSEILTESGFRNVYRSEEQESRFSEMQGNGIYSGFDTSIPKMSLFIEATK